MTQTDALAVREALRIVRRAEERFWRAVSTGRTTSTETTALFDAKKLLAQTLGYDPDTVSTRRLVADAERVGRAARRSLR